MLQILYKLIIFQLFSLSVAAQFIPANRKVDWTLAGLQRPIPKYATLLNIQNFGGNGNGITPNDVSLETAITSLNGDSGIIFFPAGNYLFVSPVNLRSGIVLRGAGASLTTLQFLGGEDNLITAAGLPSTDVIPVKSSASKGQTYLLVNNPAAFASNSFIKLYQNDSALVLDAFKSVGQILRINNVSGDTLHLNSPLRRSYNKVDSPAMLKFNEIKGVGIECLKIKRLDSTATQTSNVLFDFATDCWVKGIESDSCNFAHLSINNSTNMLVTGSYFHGSFGFGPNGQGYGLAIQNTSGEVLAENNIFQKLRHAILLQYGANGNVVAYNYSRQTFKSESTPIDLAGDIVLHGNYPYANLFEGNIVQNIVVDASHKINGPFNTFFRNRAELYGILVSTNSGDSLNVIGNEVTGTGPGKGNYLMKGNGNLEHANNVRGTVIPAGTANLSDTSYYYTSIPDFWNITTGWPAIGVPTTFNTGSIPARQRYFQASTITVCPFTTLPLGIYHFSAVPSGPVNILSWSYDRASQVKAFEVERSHDGIYFTSLKQTGIFGNETQFRFTDNEPLNGINYYRVKMLMKNGEAIISKMVSIKSSFNKVNISPNPARDIIRVVASDVKNATITIFNSTGQRVYAKNYNNYRLSNGVIISIADLPVGTYSVVVSNMVTGKHSASFFIKE